MDEQNIEEKCEIVLEARNYIAAYFESLATNYEVVAKHRFSFFLDTLKVLLSEMIARCVRQEKQEQFIEFLVHELKYQVDAFKDYDEKEVKH